MTSQSVGAWNPHYASVVAPTPYGHSPTYRWAAEWMEGLTSLEDWGAGTAWLRQFCDPDAYVAVDGSRSEFVDVVDDLATRDTVVEGIVLRHVLEHNDNWAEILDNAVRCATRRLFVVLFTPLAEETHVLMREPEYGDVPVISFALCDITERIPGRVSTQTFESPSGSFYNVETVVRADFSGYTAADQSTRGGKP